MKLTCVTAVFNAIKSGNGENLVRCIESVAALTTEHEHLIYDGASTDGTVEILNELVKKIPGLKVVSEKDTGVYNALNKGVRDAQGEWFYVLGTDDYLCNPILLDNILAEIRKKVDIIIAPVRRDCARNLFFWKKEDLTKIFWTVPYSHQGMLIRTKFVRLFGGFDEKYRICADWDMMNKAHGAGLRFLYTYEPFAFYASGGVSETSKQTWDEVTAVIQKHLGMSEAQTIRFRNVGFPPLYKMLPYILHRDYAYRLSAKTMINKNIKYNLFRVLRKINSLLHTRK